MGKSIYSRGNVLEKIIDKKNLTFVNSNYTAERIQYTLNIFGITDIDAHHGSITKESRELMEDEFKNWFTKLLDCCKNTASKIQNELEKI